MSSTPEGHGPDAHPQAAPDAETSPGVVAAREQVAQTREELGRVVAALAGKADVKARARDKAIQVRERARDTAVHVVRSAQSTVVALRGQAANRTAGLMSRGVRTADARRATAQAAGAARQRLGGVAALVGGLAVAGLVMWRRRR
jgi:Protein of unknown function (DUF3618)